MLSNNIERIDEKTWKVIETLRSFDDHNLLLTEELNNQAEEENGSTKNTERLKTAISYVRNNPDIFTEESTLDSAVEE